MVEEAFSTIPALHPGVNRIIPVSIRHWRKHPFAAGTWRAIARLRDHFRQTHYDDIIDTQGLLKSALLTWMANGRRHGLNWKSSREPLRLFYDHVYEIPWSMHAVERNRRLAATALGCSLSGAADYGLATQSETRAIEQDDHAAPAADAFAMLLHATSAESKEWPEQHWVELGAELNARNLQSVLPYGNEKERQRSERLAAAIRGAHVPPPLGLRPLAELMRRARIVVGVDTGLTHLAVALGRPTIGLYCATDPAATGLYGSSRAVNLGAVGLTPSPGDVAAAIHRLLALH